MVVTHSALPFCAQAALSALKYLDIREGNTDQPYGFFLAHSASKPTAETFHIVVSEGDPHNFGLKSTCGSTGFVANPGAPVPTSPSCIRACNPPYAKPDNPEDCAECNCALLVANYFNALPSFYTYTVLIFNGIGGTDLAFESAKLTLQVCQLYTH